MKHRRTLGWMLLVLAASAVVSCSQATPPRFGFTNVEGKPAVLVRSCGADSGAFHFVQEDADGIRVGTSESVDRSEVDIFKGSDDVFVVPVPPNLLPDGDGSETDLRTFLEFVMSGSVSHEGTVRLPGGPWPDEPKALPEMSADPPNATDATEIVGGC